MQPGQAQSWLGVQLQYTDGQVIQKPVSDLEPILVNKCTQMIVTNPACCHHSNAQYTNDAKNSCKALANLH